MKISPSEFRIYGTIVKESQEHYLLKEVAQAISQTEVPITKKSKEKTKRGRLVLCPRTLNARFRKQMIESGWKAGGMGYGEREIDFVKDCVGVEFQLGKYAFLNYDKDKLEIFRKLGQISLGVIVTPAKALQKQASTGVPCAQNLIDDLDALQYEQPLVVIGVEPKQLPSLSCPDPSR